MNGIRWMGEGFYGAQEFETYSVFHFLSRDVAEAERLAAALGYLPPIWIDTEGLSVFECVIRDD